MVLNLECKEPEQSTYSGSLETYNEQVTQGTILQRVQCYTGNSLTQGTVLPRVRT